MSAQELLTFLFDAIAISFIIIAAFDLGREIIILYKQVFVTPQQPPLTNSQPRQLLPDPWLLPAAEASAPVQITQVQQKPILLLAPARAVEEVLLNVDVDTLKLRDARKLAKALGIAQKVNSRDQNLAFLRSQIKAKLQQETSRLPEAMAAGKQKLVAC